MRTVYFDVDGTLVLWDKDRYPGLPSVFVTDVHGDSIELKIHTKHLYILKSAATRGDCVIVWSAAGAEWARAVGRALEIDDFVIHYLQKPDSYFDDEEPKFWLNQTPRWFPPS